MIQVTIGEGLLSLRDPDMRCFVGANRERGHQGREASATGVASYKARRPIRSGCQLRTACRLLKEPLSDRSKYHRNSNS